MLDTSFEDDFVDITVESRVGEVSELLDAAPVVVFFLGPLAESVRFAVLVGQDARAASVQPVAWVLLRVAGANSLGNSFGGAFVVGGIGGVCGSVSGRSLSWSSSEFHSRSTTSALAASSFRRSESSLPPRTMRMLGKAFFTTSAFSCVRTSAEYS